jgi:hypothetical protein
MPSLARFAAALSVLATWPAAAETVNCTPITAIPALIDVQGVYCLRSDLSGALPDGSAIFVATNNVTIDLNGYKLGNLAAGPGTTATGVSGVDRQNVIVRNGVIRGFQTGLHFDGADSLGIVAEDLRLDQNRLAGVWLGGQGNAVRRCRIARTGGTTAFGADAFAYGVVIASGGSEVVDNAIAEGLAQGSGASIGVQVQGMVQNVFVVGNRISDFDQGVRFVAGTAGKIRGNLTSGVGTPYTGGTDAGDNN